jgi:erythromycin esterase-like protein
VHIEPKAGDMKPMGVFLADWLGRKVYTIGMTAYQGTDALVTGGPATIIPPPAADSLEGRLHALGRPFVFLDLRSGSGPVRAPLSARIPKYESVAVPDAGRIYDGIFYIDQMAPATKLR